jgi:hypothetical protein
MLHASTLFGAGPAQPLVVGADVQLIPQPLTASLLQKHILFAFPASQRSSNDVAALGDAKGAGRALPCGVRSPQRVVQRQAHRLCSAAQRLVVNDLEALPNRPEGHRRRAHRRQREWKISVATRKGQPRKAEMLEVIAVLQEGVQQSGVDAHLEAQRVGRHIDDVALRRGR